MALLEQRHAARVPRRGPAHRLGAIETRIGLHELGRVSLERLKLLLVRHQLPGVLDCRERLLVALEPLADEGVGGAGRQQGLQVAGDDEVADRLVGLPHLRRGFAELRPEVGDVALAAEDRRELVGILRVLGPDLEGLEPGAEPLPARPAFRLVLLHLERPEPGPGVEHEPGAAEEPLADGGEVAEPAPAVVAARHQAALRLGTEASMAW